MKKQRSSRLEIVLILAIAVLLIILGAVLIWKFVITPNNLKIEDVKDTPVVVEQEEVAVIPVATKEELLAEVNKRRAEAGVAPLRYSPELEATAQAKCDDMVTNNYYGHDRPNGEPWHQLMTSMTGWQGHFTENLMMQSQIDDSAKAVFDGWNKSDAHREALLNTIYTLTGFGVCGDTAPNSAANPTYFVEHFYGP